MDKDRYIKDLEDKLEGYIKLFEIISSVLREDLKQHKENIEDKLKRLRDIAERCVDPLSPSDKQKENVRKILLDSLKSQCNVVNGTVENVLSSLDKKLEKILDETTLL